MPDPTADRRRRRLAGLRTASRLVLANLLIMAAVSLSAAQEGVLSGIVRDSLGNVLSGVEVLVLVPTRTTLPVATVTSDEQGRFRVDELRPGSYKLAALKRGYLTFVGQINTAVQKTVALVLHPVPVNDGELAAIVPEDDSWALRVPRRGILHERDAGPPGDSGVPAEGASQPGSRDSMSMQLDHLFAVGAPSSSGRSESSELDSMETRMMLASALGDRGNIRVRGLRSSLDSENGEGPPSSASQITSAMQVNVSYEPSREDQLAFNAYFSRHDFEVSGGPTAVASLQQQHKSWGYDASWSRRIDAQGVVAVQLDYRDSSLAAPPRDAVALVEAPRGFSNRAVGARASYRRQHGDDHEIEVALGAQLLQWPGSSVGVESFSRGADYDSSPSQWNLQLDGQDRWWISRPVALIYGIGYKQAIASGHSGIVAPRFGGNWQTHRVRLQGVVSYHAFVNRNAPATDRTGKFGSHGPVGYDALMEILLTEGIRLQGGSSYTPILFDYFGFGQGIGEPGGQPLWVSNGNASVFHNRLALTEDRGASQTYVELAGGRAEGTLTPFLPFDEPMGSTPERDLLYHNARFGMRFPTRGTDLSFQYQWVSAAASEPDRTDDATQESVEVRLRQAISGIRLPGVWQVLVALRVGSVDSDSLDQWEERGGDDESLAALNRRIGAGVSVLF